MSQVTLRDLLEAGVHFGHQTRLWNPRMRPYIYGHKNGIHIIDLQKTAIGLLQATQFVSHLTSNGESILFVGTKRTARELVATQAERSRMFFINNRWLGGTLTNFKTIKNSIDRLNAMERAESEGRTAQLHKKEALEMTREIKKMNKFLGGLKHMKKLPGALFIIDPKKEHIAVKEAIRLKIPIIALCDTNCDPQGIQYVIPGNDDALKSIDLFVTAIADAAIAGTQQGRAEYGGAVANVAGDQGSSELSGSGDEAFDVVHRSHVPTSGSPEASVVPE